VRSWHKIRVIPRLKARFVPQGRAPIRDRGQHLEDLAVLFASCDSFSNLEADRLTASERRHLRAAVSQLSDMGHVAWAVVNRSTEHSRSKRALQWPSTFALELGEHLNGGNGREPSEPVRTQTKSICAA